MNWVAQKAGYERSKSGMARSWLRMGMPITSPVPGDLAIFWRKSRNSRFGHVGIFLGFAEGEDKVYVLGGNQDNSVSIKVYHRSKLLGFRRLRLLHGADCPKPILKKGSQGTRVRQLQEILKSSGFYTGMVDGEYGPLTENAIVKFQSSTEDIEVNGIYDKDTYKKMNAFLKQQRID